MPAIDAVRNPLSLGGLTLRYVVALGVVAALSLSAYTALTKVIDTQENAAAVINVSGRQRMLSQRIALLSDRLVTTQDPPLRASISSQMTNAVNELEQAHEALLHGDTLRGLPGNPSAAVQGLYFGDQYRLDGLLRAYVGHARDVLADPTATEDHNGAIAIQALGPTLLLTGLDAVVRQYQREAETDIQFLQLAETMVVVVTLGVLCLEAVFIFRPMVRRVVAERRALIEAERRIQAVIDSSHDGIVTIDADGVIATANPAAVTLFGGDGKGLIGRRFADLVVDEHWLDGVMSRWSDLENLGEGVRTVPVRSSAGDPFYVEIALSSVRLQGEPLMVAILRRSTERLERYAKDLERINTELDQFVYVASHDLKAPLRAIGNLATWIEEDLGDNRALVADNVDLLRQRVVRMEGLIEGMRTYATTGGGPGAVEAVDVGRLVEEVFNEHTSGGDFRLRIPHPLPIVHADRLQLWQVFTNLIGNAVHHSGGTGSVTVTAESNETGYRFAVADDGPGIDPAHVDKIFVIFQTLAPKDRDGHLGLGLALVKKIVEGVGGTISVVSEPGSGAMFQFDWPKAVA